MEKRSFEISIDEPKELFSKHLDLEHNRRIIFSAPFGTGKTYFLDKFFRERRDEKVIHLFPVNYSVSSNEDVFELIKFDILLQLLEDGDLRLEDNVFDDFFTAQFYLFYNADKFTEWLFDKFGKAGKSINKYSKQVRDIVEGYKEFKKKVEENTKKKEAIDFLLEIKDKKGSAYEEDAITQLIQSFLQQLCGADKQSVLIIDDLDRIDPEHIFRLLNVFAAHFDIGAPDTNKFGFDKVVFVCDISNVRNIFYAKYGDNTDFSGYIDKFFSTEIYSFNNINAVIRFISTNTTSHFFANNIDTAINLRFLEKTTVYFKGILEYILNCLYVNKLLNLRNLSKVSRANLNISEYALNFTIDGKKLRNYNSLVVYLFDILRNILGDYNSVFICLNKVKHIESKNRDIQFSNYNFKRHLEIFYMFILPILFSEYDFSLHDSNDPFEIEVVELKARVTMQKPKHDPLYFEELAYYPYGRINNFEGAEYDLKEKLFPSLILAFEKLRGYGHLVD